MGLKINHLCLYIYIFLYPSRKKEIWLLIHSLYWSFIKCQELHIHHPIQLVITVTQEGNFSDTRVSWVGRWTPPKVCPPGTVHVSLSRRRIFADCNEVRGLERRHLGLSGCPNPYKKRGHTYGGEDHEKTRAEICIMSTARNSEQCQQPQELGERHGHPWFRTYVPQNWERIDFCCSEPSRFVAVCCSSPKHRVHHLVD